MKNFRMLSFAVLFITFLISCSQKPGEMIIGNWKISEITSTGEIPVEIKEAYKKNLDDMKASYLLVINADSTYEHTISETTNKGKWSLSTDAKILNLTTFDGQTEAIDIEELTSDKFIISNEMNNIKNTIALEKQVK